MLWLFFFIAAAITILTEQEQVLLFIAAGLLYVFIKSPAKWFKKSSAVNVVFLTGFGFWQFELSTLGQIAWFFTKAGAFIFGSGLAIVPFLHGGVVNQLSLVK